MIEYMCENCKRVKNLKCTVYAEPPLQFVKKQHCPMNTQFCKKAKAKRRVGQQKQRKR